MMAQWASHYRMPRWCIPVLFSLILTVSQASAQFGGMRFPGSRNPNGYPGQQGGNGTQNTPKAYGSTEDLTGTLQQISSSNLVIDAGDDRIVLVQVQNGTKYLSTMGKVKASDFEPGDHVTVEATLDSNDHYFSKTITMNKKGTPEEKAAAMQASNSSSHSGGGGGGSSPDSDSDPDRPKLHRSNPDDSASAAPTENTAAPQRSASAPSSAGSGSGSSSGSASGSRQSSDDDSGPPVLRRGSASASAQQASAQPASSQSETQASAPAASQASGGSRPSLSAEDVNGVTRVPVTTPPPGDSETASLGREQSAPRMAPASASASSGGDYGGGDPIIEQAREAAFSFSETLPNYVVKQLTNRYATGSANRGRTSWQPLDIVTTDLVYEDGKERYTNIMVNGKPTKYIEQTGSWSEGEFASMLQAILAPGTNADFRNQHPVTLVNRPAYRYDYTVAQPRSTWTLHADGQTYAPSYTGSIWIDKATYRVLRIEIAARNLPRDFPLDTAESSIDYDFVMIGDQKVLLPAAAESLSCTRGTPDCSKNHTEFHNYRKYGADTSISFEGPADSK